MTQPLEIMLDNILADPLAATHGATDPVGYVGFDIPLEILITPGRCFSHLPWQKGRPTPQADRWLESAFPGWANSILEDWIDGAFDHFGHVVFTRGDDASQRLYYYVCELQRRNIIGGPRPVLYDVAKIFRDTSLAHCRLAIHKLMQTLDIPDAGLEEAVDIANARRSLYGMLDLARVGPGRLYAKMARASLFRDNHAEIVNAELPRAAPMPRLLLAGSVPPDESLHLAIEAAGWNVVGEVHQLNLSRFGPPVELDVTDPLYDLARHYNSCPFGPRAFGDSGSRLRAEMQRTQSDAVVLWLTNSDEALAWHVIRQREVFEEQGLPFLILTGRRWDGSDGVTQEITAFLEGLSR